MTYAIHCVGGPDDRHLAFALKPYFRMKHSDNAVYLAAMDGQGPFTERVDDELRFHLAQTIW